jgi:hypothetical protein
MKHLRIESGKGEYSLDGTTWIEIDQLSREDLLKLVGFALESDLLMDIFDAGSLLSPAHQIVYKHVHDRLTELIENRTRFTDDVAALFADAFEKYGGTGAASS